LQNTYCIQKKLLPSYRIVWRHIREAILIGIRKFTVSYGRNTTAGWSYH